MPLIPDSWNSGRLYKDKPLGKPVKSYAGTFSAVEVVKEIIACPPTELWPAPKSSTTTEPK